MAVWFETIKNLLLKSDLLKGFIPAERVWKANSHFFYNVFKQSPVGPARLSPKTYRALWCGVV